MAVKTIESSTITRETYTTNFVQSQDGTKIGYRQYGAGDGLVLIQGTMGTAQHFHQLAQLLADTFTVYVPDRRGRGISESGTDYSIQKEVEDLEAILSKTGTHKVFGLSAGAIISLEAALSLPDIHKLAIFEPPLFLDKTPRDAVERYEAEMAQGKIASALVTAMLAAEMGPAIFQHIPRWILESFVKMGISQEAKKGAGDYPTMSELAGTLHNDFQIVLARSQKQSIFEGINTKVLLLGGSKSAPYLKNALNALEKIIPQTKRIEFAGLGHAAAWNSDKDGNPEPVAEELRLFFA